MSRRKSLSSSYSLTGAPQSITEWLVLWEKDPVEILLDLGFGTEEPDVCTKIPPRFLSGASVAKGINIRVFLEAQKQRIDIERPNLYERFRQLEVLDHVSSAFSSLLTDVNNQQTKARGADQDETSLLDSAKSRPAVTRAKQIGQLLKRTSLQKMLLNQSLWVPGEDNLLTKKEQPCSCEDIAERETVQMGFPTLVTLGYLTQEKTIRDKGASAYPMSHCPLTPSGKPWASSHLSPACEVPSKDWPRKESPLLVPYTLKKVANLNCALLDSFEMEEIQSFEDETLCENAPDTTSAEVMVTRTSSCQSDSSGFMEELPEPVVLQNSSLSGIINFISDIHDQETTLTHKTVFPTLNQDFQEKPDDCVAEVFTAACDSILTAPISVRACCDQGEETHLLLTAENGNYQACNGEPESFVQEILCGMDKKEDKTERKQLEKERCIKEHSPCFQDDTQDEGDPSSSKFDCHLRFSTGQKKVNVILTELNDINHSDISESRIRGEDEGERHWTEQDTEAACHESVRGGHTGGWWGVGVVSYNGTLFAVNDVTNRQEFCEMDDDSKNTRLGLTETLQWGSATESGNDAASSHFLQVPQRHPCCLAEQPGLSSTEDQETGSIVEILGANKSEQGDASQNSDIASAPLKSVTVQMSSGLEFTSRAKGTGQNVPLSKSLAKEDPVGFSNMLAHGSEGGPLIWSDLGALKGDVKQNTEASSQTNIPARKHRQLPVLCPPHAHLTKSGSLDSLLSGRYRSRYRGEACGTSDVQGSHCCHCCWCHGCCLWTVFMAVCPRCRVGCCSNHATAELQLFKMLMLLQDTPTHNLARSTLHEIEVMKSSCQHFQKKLDEIEQHLMEQQTLFAGTMPDEGREEGVNLQLLRQAVRQEMAELEFRLNDQACQVKESILTQLDQLLAEQSHLFSELGLSDWKGERKAQNKKMFPDAADTMCPQSERSETVLQTALSKTMMPRGSISAPWWRPPPTLLPTRTTPEPNSSESAPQEFTTTKKEIKGPPQAKMDFKVFIHNWKKSFQNSLGNDSAEGKD